MAFTLRGSHLNGVAVEKLTEAVLKVLLCAGAFTWAVCRTSKRFNRDAFLTFSVVCFAFVLCFSYFWRSAEVQTEGRKEKARRLATYFTEGIKQASSGNMPIIKPTGDAEFDAFLSAMNAFFQGYFGYLNRMEDEIADLHCEDAFSASVLTNKDAITSEMRKRVASQNIIEQYKNGFPPMIESGTAKVTSLRASDEFTNSAIRGFKKRVNASASQLSEMFSLRLRREKAEADFLTFMLSVFGDYQFTENNILFKTPTNAQKHNQLVAGINDAIKDAETYRQRQLGEVESAKTQLEKLAP